jgi:diguanylate cyclase (GGDEF)-like protein
MSTVPDSISQPIVVPVVGAPLAPTPADSWMTELQSLLRELEAVTAASHTLPPVFSASVDDQLVQIRLGMAASLFTALQCRNAAVAGHAFRVALTCSAWALNMDLPASERDAIELAALLHDIGIIGVPDCILLKPGALAPEEADVMRRARTMSLDILRRSCSSPPVLEIVENIAAWYDGGSPGIVECPYMRRTANPAAADRDTPPESARVASSDLQVAAQLSGQHIPLGARMIAIVEAFDAMTTDHVYRPARSHERAMAELFECSGTQFDPELVQRFADFRQGDQTAVRWEVAHRWLRSLEPDLVNSFWELHATPAPKADVTVDALFQDRLLDNMYDAVVFIDAMGRVALWNRGTERLTGIAGVSVCGEIWRPELLGLSDEKGRAINEADCPVHTSIGCGVQSLRRLTILGRGQRTVAVDTHAIPVLNEHGISQGTILLLHDASSETSLEQRCQNLYEQATRDPMTQVANRAEFDRVHAMFVTAHKQQQVPCSLVMCDLDRFKLVNDTYGHQTGDEVIKCLASLLKSSCRPGDLVARYGGEEFVMLCADCDNAAATRRAEQICKTLSQIPQPKMGGRCITSSFGVTEIQPGDTPETMLRRADRALLMAKANGRNTVVQLGSGGSDAPEEPSVSRHPSSGSPKELVQQSLVTAVPVRIAIEKLRGFVADHQAKILAIDGSRVQLEIEDRTASRLRRFTDRSESLLIDLVFEEERVRKDRADDTPSPGSAATRTKIKITVSSRRNRDRRREEVMARARDVLVSFRSYLMASEEGSAEPVTGVLRRARKVLTPWLMK